MAKFKGLTKMLHCFSTRKYKKTSTQKTCEILEHETKPKLSDFLCLERELELKNEQIDSLVIRVDFLEAENASLSQKLDSFLSQKLEPKMESQISTSNIAEIEIVELDNSEKEDFESTGTEINHGIEAVGLVSMKYMEVVSNTEINHGIGDKEDFENVVTEIKHGNVEELIVSKYGDMVTDDLVCSETGLCFFNWSHSMSSDIKTIIEGVNDGDRIMRTTYEKAIVWVQNQLKQKDIMDMVLNYANQLFESLPSPMGELIINCNSVSNMPNITITIGSTTFTLTLEQNLMLAYASLTCCSTSGICCENTYISVPKKGYWQFQIGNFLNKNYSPGFSKGSCSAITDAGTSLVAGPIVTHDKLCYESLPTQMGELVIDWSSISNMSNITFTIGSIVFTLTLEQPMHDLVSGTNNGNNSFDEDGVTREELVNTLIREVNREVYEDIEDVVAFVKWLDDALCLLVDERAVLEHSDWPEKKVDALRVAALWYEYLKNLESEVCNYKNDYQLPCATALKEILALSERMERSVYIFTQTRDSLVRHCEDFQIPTDWLRDDGILSQIMLGLVTLAKTYMERVALELQSKRTSEKDSSMMLFQGNRLVFRIYQFTGEFDEETMNLFEEFRNLALM